MGEVLKVKLAVGEWQHSDSGRVGIRRAACACATAEAGNFR
eukprot:CAMPEP_0183416028 /NCGR_PEP_ID=MMETSP0370-20130417/23503_1 /TAXON_ID=268820 /ORGANISM="Peridinium aciculiferum, Strain PAER-2" /LENGTH=40 /DNA_ID= /DNA_START= /DNA_END= /DNA_ORIENTATION=